MIKIYFFVILFIIISICQKQIFNKPINKQLPKNIVSNNPTNIEELIIESEIMLNDSFKIIKKKAIFKIK